MQPSWYIIKISSPVLTKITQQEVDACINKQETRGKSAINYLLLELQMYICSQCMPRYTWLLRSGEWVYVSAVAIYLPTCFGKGQQGSIIDLFIPSGIDEEVSGCGLVHSWQLLCMFASLQVHSSASQLAHDHIKIIITIRTAANIARPTRIQHKHELQADRPRLTKDIAATVASLCLWPETDSLAFFRFWAVVFIELAREKFIATKLVANADLNSTHRNTKHFVCTGTPRILQSDWSEHFNYGANCYNSITLAVAAKPHSVQAWLNYPY